MIGECSAFRVQNTLYPIVTRTHRFSSITGPLVSLHWLPVKFRVQFKLGLITYKVYKNKYPAYWKNTYSLIGAYIILGAANLLVICLAFHTISVNSTNPLHIGPIVFSIRLRLWNSLPETCRCASSLGSFHVLLKTYLWTKSFLP